ncbi:hypothetical protein Goari_016609 [Gossypium aridum]|uniref:Uncharacterized protein n=1 Tax=Gossypium aridum TaxID=34290 RepID=A0A7J8WK55_GOSAI|nr:hypothetical protein [Gossypium aridum]
MILLNVLYFTTDSFFSKALVAREPWNRHGENHGVQQNYNLDPSLGAWTQVTLNEEDLSYLFDETTPVKDCGKLPYYVTHNDNITKELEEKRETSSQVKRRRMLQFDTHVVDSSLICNEMPSALLKPRVLKMYLDCIIEKDKCFIYAICASISSITCLD